MRVVCQRVKSANVKVNQEVVGSIEKGFLLYIGFHISDDETHVEKMIQKISKLRIYEDEAGKLNLNLSQVSGEVLAISQFTLYGDVKHNHRPSFTEAAKPDIANELYQIFVEKLREHFSC